jgi:hypothetical protein
MIDHQIVIRRATDSEDGSGKIMFFNMTTHPLDCQRWHKSAAVNCFRRSRGTFWSSCSLGRHLTDRLASQVMST